ncbi:MAG TPA: ATP-dependent DNA helicase, partial [Candidatus Eremiobacteraceae bacterium]|nr:ATP-dependent DNA helicase [Candidatus Eremiobacteraceae bacterium]
FQDSDRLQLALLRELAGPKREADRPTPELCFIGDANQSIYRFRGASPANVASVEREFRCTRLTLGLNRRCAPEVVEAANRTPMLEAASLTQAEAKAGSGSVELARPQSPEEEVQSICDWIGAQVSSGTVASQVAVLLRVTEPYRSLVSAELGARGIAVAEAATAGILDDACVQAMVAALQLLQVPDDVDRWTALLRNPVVGYRAVTVQMAFDAARRARIDSPFAALDAFPPEGPRPIAEFLAAWRRVERHAARAGIDKLLVTIATELDLLRPLRVDEPVPGFDPMASPARLSALIGAAHDFHSVYGGDARGRDAISRFLTELGGLAGLLGDAADAPSPLAGGVRVMSIHAAKGLEFDAVVVPQALDGILPQHDRGHALLPSQTAANLAARGLAPFLEPAEIRKEEASLWYVALTRAKRHVLVTATRYDDEGIEVTLSPFAESMAEPETAGLDSTSRRVEAALAEAIVAMPEPQRGVLGLRDYLRVRPVLDAIARGTDVRSQGPSPLHYDPSSVSPTSINTYLQCPRRYFYQYVLALEPHVDEDNMTLGNILHEALHGFHAVEMRFDRAPSASERARWSDLLRDCVARAVGESARVIGASPDSSIYAYHHERARRVLFEGPDSYVDHLADLSKREPFEVLACEREVTTTIDGVLVRGRADRVDRLLNGGLAIRDYKSGKIKGDLVKRVREAFRVLDRGESLVGNVPDGLNLQTLIYLPGVETAFADRVRTVEFSYFGGKERGDEPWFEETAIVADGEAHDGAALSRGEAERAVRDVAVAIARELGSGELHAFAVTDDETVCRYCGFARLCPGPGSDVA